MATMSKPVLSIEWPGAPEKGDAHDYFEHGGTVAEVEELVSAVPIGGQTSIGTQPLRLATYDDDDNHCGSAVIVRLSDVKREVVTWLWRGRIPLGKLTLIEGDPGLGKSIWTLLIAARVSTGAPMPDGSMGDLTGPAGVVLITAEDGLSDTIKPRLEAAGADPARIVALDGVKDGDDQRMADLTDLSEIRQAIRRVNAKLVIIDPLMAFLPAEVDSHRDQDARRILAPLGKLAEEAGAAIVVVRHLNKNTAVPSMYRGGGSIGIIGAVRSALVIAKDPDDPTGHRRVIAMQKQNLAAPSPSCAFRVVADDYNVPCIAWEGESAHTAESVLATRRDNSDSKLLQAQAFLHEILAESARPATEVMAEARKRGISDKTLYRAKKELGILSPRQGFGAGGGWHWALAGNMEEDAEKLEENPKE
jgi:archaellum biogenesis ATPase FlaH